jgi:hypothetical protein
MALKRTVGAGSRRSPAGDLVGNDAGFGDDGDTGHDSTFRASKDWMRDRGLE